MPQVFDIAFLGNYTQDTIVTATGARLVDGGAFNYGAHVAARMGLCVAAITRLAVEDWRVVEALAAAGVEVFARRTPTSTLLRLEYPSDNPDERVIEVTSTAGAFPTAQVAGIEARAFVLGPSFRGEVPLEVVRALAAKDVRIAADVQGWVRVVRDRRLAFEDWPEAEQFLTHMDILKADSVEAEMLTGQAGLRRAAGMLAAMGPAEIVLTHRDGLLVLAEGRAYEAGFYPTELVGRSGRGDTCLAAYTAKRLSAPPGEATLWAAAVASLKMEAEGPFQRDIADVEALLDQRYR